MPIIARKLPVFEELAGQYAFWFEGLQAQDLASALQNWLALFSAGQAPDSRNMPWLTWDQSAEELPQVIWGNDWLLHYPDLPSCAADNTDHSASTCV